MWDFHNTWNTTVKTMKMSVDSKTALCHYNKPFPRVEDMRERAGLETCGSSVRMATLQLVQVEKQAKCMSVWSLNDKKNTVSAPLCGSQLFGKRNMDSLPTEGASATMCTAFAGSHFPPQHSTIHQWLQQSYWAFTRHLHIPDKRNKKHFKATLPAVPTLFHLSNAYKTVKEGQMLLRGTAAHLLPASTSLKMLLFLLKKRIYHTCFSSTITRNYSKPQGPDRTFHLENSHLK